MLSLSGVDPLHLTLGPMVGPHVLLGMLEGIMTIALLFLIKKNTPGFLLLSEKNYIPATLSQAERGEKNWYFLLALALVIAVFVSPFASRHPGGLEKLALDYESRGRAMVVYYHAPLAEYVVPGIDNERMANGVAGLIGVLLTFGVCWTTGMLFVDKKQEITAEAQQEISSY